MSGAEFARAAAGFAGAPFRLHGRDPATGLDCVGLVAAALARCGATPLVPTGYRLRALTVEPLLDFAARNDFAPLPEQAETLPGDLLLVHPSPLQAHLVIALERGSFVHAHAGLGRVVREAAPLPWPPAMRWRLATKG